MKATEDEMNVEMKITNMSNIIIQQVFSDHELNVRSAYI